MHNRIHTGISALDARIIGVSEGNPILYIGAAGAGKTLAALHFVLEGVRNNERSLFLSSMATADLIAFGERMGFPIADATRDGLATFLTYASLRTTEQADPFALLPYETFAEIARYCETHRIKRLVLDTVLPWIAETSRTFLFGRMDSFIQELTATRTTSLLTLPEAVSPLAEALTEHLSSLVPTAIQWKLFDDGGRELSILRNLGTSTLPPPMRFRIETGVGLVVESQRPPSIQLA